MTEEGKGTGRGNFLAEGFRELGRKIERSKLRGAMRKSDAERVVALAALGQKAWEGKVDLSSFADLRDKLAGLDTQAGALSETTSKLDQEKAALEAEKRAELEKFTARRKVVEEKKSPVDKSLRDVRSLKSSCEKAIKQGESRQAAIAGKFATLDRDIATLGAATAPEQAPKLAAAQSERTKLVAENGELAAKLAKARDELPRHASEESAFAGESQKYAAEIAAIDAGQKAAIGHIDTNLARVRKETQGATQQASAVQKDRAGNFGVLGQALYDSQFRPMEIGGAVEGVAAIDRAREQARTAHDASLYDSQSLAGGTMAKFWGVMVGVPVLLAALGAGTYQFLQRRAAPAPVVQSAPALPGKSCAVQAPPIDGEGVGVTADCTRTEGTFVEGRLHGKGRKSYASGELLEGQFFNGYLYGPGVRVYHDGRRFDSEFSGGRPMGQGKLTMPDGTTYTGRFWGPMLLGWGVRRSPSGEILAGDWREAPGGEMKPFGTMLRVRPDGTKEKIEAATLDPAAAIPAAPATQAPQATDGKLY